MPLDLARLARLNALELSDSRWHYDVQKLVVRLKQELGVTEQRAVTTATVSSQDRPHSSSRRIRLKMAGGVMVTILLLGGGFWLKAQFAPPGEGTATPPVDAITSAVSKPAVQPKAAPAPLSEARSTESDIHKAIAPKTPAPTAQSRSQQINLLNEEEGGQLVIATDQSFGDILKTNGYNYFSKKDNAVFGFKDERAATFDRFAILVDCTADEYVKEFELLYATDSPTAEFKSIGVFQTQNYLIKKTPYQEFQFSPVTAKYFKIIPISSHGGKGDIRVNSIQLWGLLQ